MTDKKQNADKLRFDEMLKGFSKEDRDVLELNLRLNQKQETIDEIADRLRISHAENLRLMLIMEKAGISFQEAE